MVSKLNTDCSFLSSKNIKKIEEKYNAKYVCETTLPNGSRSCAVFYADKAHPVSKSRYFSIFWDQRLPNDEPNLMIANGDFVKKQLFLTAVADDGELLFSRYRHDCRYSKDGSAMIDGGRDYARTNGCPIIVLQVRRGKFQEKQKDE